MLPEKLHVASDGEEDKGDVRKDPIEGNRENYLLS